MGGPPPTRGIAGASSGQNGPLSELISLICEPLAASTKHGFEKISSSDVLSKIDEINKKSSFGHKHVNNTNGPADQLNNLDGVGGITVEDQNRNCSKEVTDRTSEQVLTGETSHCCLNENYRREGVCEDTEHGRMMEDEVSGGFEAVEVEEQNEIPTVIRKTKRAQEIRRVY